MSSFLLPRTMVVWREQQTEFTLMAKAFILTIPSVPYAFSFIRPSIEAFATECGLLEDKANKLTLAAEEVFSYCCKLVSKGKKPTPIAVSFDLEKQRIAIIIEYIGPKGSLEKRLSATGSGIISRDSFEALGLYIAKETVDNLYYQYLFDGTNKYSLVVDYEIPKNIFSRFEFIE